MLVIGDFGLCSGNMSQNRTRNQRNREIRQKFGKVIKCFCPGEQLGAVDEMVPSLESLAIKDFSEIAYSSKAGEIEKKLDTGNIEEAESSLRESCSLNSEVGFPCLALKFAYLLNNHFTFTTLLRG